MTPMASGATVEQAEWEERAGILFSPALASRGVVAGFTTRALGSMGGRATPSDEASERRAAVAARLGFDAVVRTKQVHGETVVRADGPFETWPEADGMWTGRAGVLLGIVAADCVAVLAADDEGRIGAAHAGWEGTSRQIARRLIGSLRAAGADPSRIVAALGPSIGPCCYTIGGERARVVQERLGDLGGGTIVERDGELVFDLWKANVAQLREDGVGRIEVSGTCTKSGGRELWSYRGRESSERGSGLGLAFIGRITPGASPPRSPRLAEDPP